MKTTTTNKTIFTCAFVALFMTISQLINAQGHWKLGGDPNFGGDAVTLANNFLGTDATNGLSIKIGTRGISRMYVSDGGGGSIFGFIGLGNNFFTPKNRLHLHQGTSAADNSFVYTQWTNFTTGYNSNLRGFQVGIDATGLAQLKQMENMDMAFYTNAIETARITAAGNVGIATATPSETLQVKGTAKVDVMSLATSADINIVAVDGNGGFLNGGTLHAKPLNQLASSCPLTVADENYIPKWSTISLTAHEQCKSIIYDDGASVGVQLHTGSSSTNIAFGDAKLGVAVLDNTYSACGIAVDNSPAINPANNYLNIAYGALIFATSKNNLNYGIQGSSAAGNINNGGSFYATNPDNSAPAIANHTGHNTGAYGVAYGNYNNYGVLGEVGGGTNQLNTAYNYGVYAKTHTSAQTSNYGVYATVQIPLDIPPPAGSINYAGYFVGDVHRTGNDNFSSDSILKTNVDTISNALQVLNTLIPHRFQWNRSQYPYLNMSSGEHYGFIAQECQGKPYVTDMVCNNHFPEQRDTAGNVTVPALDYKGFSYIEMIALLTKGMQEQQRMINALQTSLDSIKTNCCNHTSTRQSQDQYNGTDPLQDLKNRVDNLENCCSMKTGSPTLTLPNGEGTEPTEELKLNVSPNPYNNTCTVTTTGKGKLILSTLEGVQLRSYSVSGDSKLDLNGDVLGGYSGTFIVTLVGEKEQLTKKVTFVK